MPITGKITRGSVIWLKLHPQAENEQAGYRPAIVLSDGLIDPENSSFALIAPVTNTVRDYPFEVAVPTGILISGSKVTQAQLTGVVLTDQVKSLDLSARHAEVIGQIDPKTPFFLSIITNVRSILA
ncbi:transcriptional modulator of MazE/toxin, MazF [Fontibacillus panacisegetis]|uniref:Transcriptional modulator of MazE/toxin, MazF n=1 Tax=Fontibacillus panacisegetis TaxID=670482 RepID=A0A1G7T4D2_9BACL|nr:type II toxin-antitoxin system PemK/MazF family toxin [Fontibacillus panacisegetis]SDG29874.1 transcriptional modulator of MazE/toxin, MazF [Fontibacillus panacisegetis]